MVYRKIKTSPENINIKAENDMVDIDIKIHTKREIRGSYDLGSSDVKRYIPEFREFAVALSRRIGKSEAAEELGIKETNITRWMGMDNKRRAIYDAMMRFWKKRADVVRDALQPQIDKLQEENDKLRQYIKDNIVTSILQK